MTNVEALKALYVALGGNADNVANDNLTVEVLNAIAEKYSGEEDAIIIPDAIANIASVATGLVKPSGTKSITSNGSNIDVSSYAKANVNVPNPSTGSINITSNGTYDVTEKASAVVNVAGNDTKYGTVTIVNNTSKAIQVRSYTKATKAGYYYPLGWETVSIPSGSSKTVGVMLDYDIVNNKYKVLSSTMLNINMTGITGLTVSRTGGTDAGIAMMSAGVFGLYMTTALNTLSDMTNAMTVTVAEATS